MRAKQMNPDLKWLAENVTEWKGNAQYGYVYIIFDGYEVDYAKRPGENRFTYAQWHDARITLKLDQTPKYSNKGDVIIACLAAAALACASLLSVVYP